jgi:hypothetical protein
MTIRPDSLEFRARALDAMPLGTVRRCDDSTIDLDLYLPPRVLVERDAAANGFVTIPGSRNNTGVSCWIHNHDRAQRACRRLSRPRPLGWRRVTKYCQGAHNASALRGRLRSGEPHRARVDLPRLSHISPVRRVPAAVGTADALPCVCGLCV